LISFKGKNPIEELEKWMKYGIVKQ
jgi:hypothetical protein